MALSAWKPWNGKSDSIPKKPEYPTNFIARVRFRDGSTRDYWKAVDPETRWACWGDRQKKTMDDIIAYQTY